MLKAYTDAIGCVCSHVRFFLEITSTALKIFELNDANTGKLVQTRVFDETLFRIFAKHETRENAPVFRETFASFASSNFRDFRVSRKL
jgi:hypothetical protein